MKPDPLEELQADIARLKTEEKKLSAQLNNRFEHFKVNYRSMLWRAINPLRNKESIVSLLYNTGKKLILPAVTQESAEELSKKTDQELAALLLVKLFNRLSKKRKKKKTEKDRIS